MNLAELRENAKEKLKGYCRVCPVCNGRACAGEVPGMGGAGTGTQAISPAPWVARAIKSIWFSSA